jgi:integrase
LSEEEFGRLLSAIDEIADPFVKAAFLLLTQTGARLSEVLHAEWRHIDLERGLWVLPSTKAGKRQVAPITAKTVSMLSSLPKLGSYVIPGRSPKTHRYDLKQPWEKLKAAAGLEDVDIHDIRRSFGLQVAKKSGLHVASKLLRHSDIRVTERVYAPLGIDDLRDALVEREETISKLTK